MADSSTLLIPHLPDDLSLRCIARIPRSSHPSLLLVSRSWCSLLRSRRLFALRAQLGVTEPSLYVNICSQYGESQWYFLNLRPCRLLPVPPPPFPTFGVGCAVIGSSLYVLGGYERSSAVQIFDPCLNRWTTAPPMAEPRKCPVVCAVNGRIYVFGGCVYPPSIPGYGELDPESGAWAEVLDPATGAWASLPRRPTHLQKVLLHRNGVFRGQVLLGEDLLFDPEAGAQPWGTVPKALSNGWAGQAVVLDGVLYTYNFMGKLAGYDHAAGVWKPVEGVEGVVTEHLQLSQLTNLGGLLCLVWEQNIENEEDIIEYEEDILGNEEDRERCMQFEIHCVGVEITRTSCGGFRGSIAWREVVAMPISDGWVMKSVVLEF